MMLLSRLHPESISSLSWNFGTCPQNLTSIAKSAFLDRSMFFSMVQFRSQKKSNVPFRLFADSLRVWSDEERLEDKVIGICPWRRFPERSKYSRRGSSNKDGGMLPFSWFDPTCAVENRHTCAVVAADPFPGAAVATLSPWSRNFRVCLQQRGSDAHKSNPLLDVAATCHWHVKYELQNAEDPKHGYHWKVAAHSFLVNENAKRWRVLLLP